MSGQDNDTTCQQILADPNRWIHVADKIREDWSRCLEELIRFEELLEEDKKNRIRWARRLKFIGFFLNGTLNIVTGLPLLIPMSKYTIPVYVGTILNTISFIFSISMWGQLSARSHEYLTLAKDTERLSMMCKNIRQKLKEVISDGRITEKERSLIRDMMGQMHKRSEEIGSLDLLMNILGANDNDASSFKFFAPDKSNYKTSFEGIDDILNEIKTSQKEITARIPAVIREYRDLQLQAQIHSSGIPQRLPDPVIRERLPDLVTPNPDAIQKEGSSKENLKGVSQL